VRFCDADEGIQRVGSDSFSSSSKTLEVVHERRE